MKLAALALPLALFAAPMMAQTGPEDLPDDVQTSILYGDDAAPECPAGIICIVARLPENDRYRIPENLRFSSDPENTAWAKRVESLEFIGRSGTLSCSTAGAGGFTGCTQELIRQAYGEKRAASAVRFADLIQAAREERLQTIDDDAADEQARVEQIEKAYMERLEAERAAPVGEEVVDPDLPPDEAVTGRELGSAPVQGTTFDDGDEEVLPLPQAE
ncbi:MAG: hypothetical protein WA954_09095 [Parerythrobacter sp.]